MDEIPNPIAERERSFALQLAGESAAVTAEAAHIALEEGPGKGYGIGLFPIKNFGPINGQDGTTVCVAITDGDWCANFKVEIARAEEVPEWLLERLYRLAGGVPRDQRYETLLASSPIPLS
jgi:hypothetical protein